MTIKLTMYCFLYNPAVKKNYLKTPDICPVLLKKTNNICYIFSMPTILFNAEQFLSYAGQRRTVRRQGRFFGLLHRRLYFPF